MGGQRAGEAGASPILGLWLLQGPWACTVPAVRFLLFQAPRPGSGTLLPLALSSGVLLGSYGSFTSYLTSRSTHPCVSKFPQTPASTKGRGLDIGF